MNTCLNCQKETANPKFCNKSCSAIYNNKLFPKRQKESTETKLKKRTLKITICIQCSKQFTYTNSKIPKFCSSRCFQIHTFDTKHFPKFLCGKADNRLAKTCLSKLHGYKCVLCGNEGIHNNQKLILQVDHIDGNSDNNKPENLRLLCPNCHTQTPTFTSRQKKNTQRNRYMRK